MSEQSVIDETTYTVTRTIRIAAPRDLVFTVLTEPAQIGQWFGQSADFPDGVHVGAEGAFTWTEHGRYPARIERYEPISAFAFTWGTPGEPIREDNSTTVTFTLEQDGDDTVLTVLESGFDSLGEASGRRAAMEENARGWTEELGDLATHVLGLAATPGTGVRPQADPATGRIVRSVLVRAPRATTWASLTDPDAIEAWWGHPAVFPAGMTAGSTGTFEWVGQGTMPMRIERFDAPEAFDLLWGGLGKDDFGDDASLVEFRLRELGDDRTLVTVTETGFRDLDDAARRKAMSENVTGWTQVLDALVAHVESGGTHRAAGDR